MHANFLQSGSMQAHICMAMLAYISLAEIVIKAALASCTDPNDFLTVITLYQNVVYVSTTLKKDFKS